MMKQYLGHVLASSLLLIGAVEIYAADVNLPASTTRIQRSFVNLDIQKPVISSPWTYLDADPALIGTAITFSFREVIISTVAVIPGLNGE